LAVEIVGTFDTLRVLYFLYCVGDGHG
jgi:hypothetical protein